MRAFLTDSGLSEADLATKAGVSQATVSRALTGKLSARGPAAKRLFKFIQKRTTNKMSTGRIVQAFDRVWNGTREHAESIARVVESLQNFCPAREEER